MNETLLSHAEAAKSLGRSPHWLYVRATGLGIPRIRIGGRWAYRVTDLQQWLDEHRVTGADRRHDHDPIRL